MNKIAFLFPGQGSQYTGMGKSLCDAHSIARETFEEANDTLGFDLQKLCFEGDSEELAKTENTQPAILTLSVAQFRVYKQELCIEPHYCAGHSLGELSALTCAGAIEFSDAVKIVRQRGRFMQKAVPIGIGAMAAVTGISRREVEEECGLNSDESRVVVIANYNSPEQIVISGHKEAVNLAADNLKAKGAKIIPLKVSAPFHSPLMNPAAEEMREELKKYKFVELKYPVISNVSARPYVSKESIPENLKSQIISPVRWQESMEFLQRCGVEVVVEMGPKTVLKNLAKRNTPDILAYAYDNNEDVSSLTDKLKPRNCDSKDSRLKLIVRCLAIAVCTKNKNWDNDKYVAGVVEPYRRVQELLAELEGNNMEPSLEQLTEALRMLKTVFITKKTDIKEQEERFKQIFDETGLGHLFRDADFQ
ncbi:ACP S-malonyltransferase [Ruminiclostridium papyrosolvens]|uniref:[acyl-carrier-protein] S-malonyltransferase n=1 Tax=Ruminiclostridium papyrosolvens C7 TaxID=1330534 RepID=U4R6L2_9FIRM|nr:ACP S-malonyltransferase [Ruminiclostridium papyrosolvens]EPR13606.1 acyltransferase [Ruminiclostridium papyrosolvens C7]